MSMVQHTISAKRATIFNPENTFIFSISVTHILLSEITSYLQEQQTKGNEKGCRRSLLG
jgi:hypothetical protein